MPIPRERFDKGKDDPVFDVLNFLKENPDQAYEVSEIARALYGLKPAGILGAFLSENVAAILEMGIILDDLAHLGKVERKLIGVKIYYSIKRGSGGI